MEEMTVDNSQLRETLRKQSEKLKELSQANGESPAGSPSMKRMNSPREMSRLKEQAADAMKMRDKLHRVQEDVSFVVIFSLSPSSLSSPLPPPPFPTFLLSLLPYLLTSLPLCLYLSLTLLMITYIVHTVHSICIKYSSFRTLIWLTTSWRPRTFYRSMRQLTTVSTIASRCSNNLTPLLKRRREHYWDR